MHSLKGLLNLPNAAKKPKWSVFTQAIQSNGITAFESIIEFRKHIEKFDICS